MIRQLPARKRIHKAWAMFNLLFLSSLFQGRAWCGWVCPYPIR